MAFSTPSGPLCSAPETSRMAGGDSGVGVSSGTWGHATPGGSQLQPAFGCGAGSGVLTSPATERAFLSLLSPEAHHSAGLPLTWGSPTTAPSPAGDHAGGRRLLLGLGAHGADPPSGPVRSAALSALRAHVGDAAAASAAPSEDVLVGCCGGGGGASGGVGVHVLTEGGGGAGSSAGSRGPPLRLVQAQTQQQQQRQNQAQQNQQSEEQEKQHAQQNHQHQQNRQNQQQEQQQAQQEQEQHPGDDGAGRPPPLPQQQQQQAQAQARHPPPLLQQQAQAQAQAQHLCSPGGVSPQHPACQAPVWGALAAAARRSGGGDGVMPPPPPLPLSFLGSQACPSDEQQRQEGLFQYQAQPQDMAVGSATAARPWDAADASGDPELAQLVRIVCAVRATADAVAERQLPVEELQEQLSALLPFLAARTMRPRWLEGSRIADVVMHAVKAVNRAVAAAGAAAAALGKGGGGGGAVGAIKDQAKRLWNMWGRVIAASVLDEEGGPAPVMRGPFDPPPQHVAPRTVFYWGTASDSDGGGGGGGGGGEGRVRTGPRGDGVPSLGQMGSDMRLSHGGHALAHGSHGGLGGHGATQQLQQQQLQLSRTKRGAGGGGGAHAGAGAPHLRNAALSNGGSGGAALGRPPYDHHHHHRQQQQQQQQHQQFGRGSHALVAGCDGDGEATDSDDDGAHAALDPRDEEFVPGGEGGRKRSGGAGGRRGEGAAGRGDTSGGTAAGGGGAGGGGARGRARVGGGSPADSVAVAKKHGSLKQLINGSPPPPPPPPLQQQQPRQPVQQPAQQQQQQGAEKPKPKRKRQKRAQQGNGQRVGWEPADGGSDATQSDGAGVHTVLALAHADAQDAGTVANGPPQQKKRVRKPDPRRVGGGSRGISGGRGGNTRKKADGGRGGGAGGAAAPGAPQGAAASSSSRWVAVAASKGGGRGAAGQGQSPRRQLFGQQRRAPREELELVDENVLTGLLETEGWEGLEQGWRDEWAEEDEDEDQWTAGAEDAGQFALAALRARAPPPLLRSAPSTTDVDVWWDLDNKYPEDVDPIAVLESLTSALSTYGTVRKIRAYGNPTTFSRVPAVVREQRRLAQESAVEEEVAAGGRKGAKADKEHRCEMCGGRFLTQLKLQKHFKQLHEREFNKKKAHKPLAKKYFSKTGGVHKFLDARAAAVLPTPGAPVRLGRLLQQHGVDVTRVSDKPQAADTALMQDAYRALRRVPGKGEAAEGAGNDNAAVAVTGEGAAEGSRGQQSRGEETGRQGGSKGGEGAEAFGRGQASTTQPWL
ncbi:hypothetical protein FOA52_008160 [Chlamydomonas sp. UWO 241]|nr:hypothetical protein FOA52_008160 [Chlamydomonas sp. UWO 241]